MITRDKLALLLQRVNGSEVARRANISDKTIYRLRRRKTEPGVDTVAAILRAIEEIRAEMVVD